MNDVICLNENNIIFHPNLQGDSPYNPGNKKGDTTHEDIFKDFCPTIGYMNPNTIWDIDNETKIDNDLVGPNTDMRYEIKLYNKRRTQLIKLMKRYVLKPRGNNITVESFYSKQIYKIIKILNKYKILELKLIFIWEEYKMLEKYSIKRRDLYIIIKNEFGPVYKKHGTKYIKNMALIYRIKNEKNIKYKLEVNFRYKNGRKNKYTIPRIEI